MKKSDKNTGGTSFHKTTITCTQHQLETVLGSPQHGVSGDEKCQMEWVCETKDGAVVTIYDWKEYRSIGLHEVIDWHIGGKNGDSTVKALEQLSKLIIN